MGENVAKSGNVSKKSHKVKNCKHKHPHCSLPEMQVSRTVRSKVGNAESTHLDRPKGKATLVPKVGSHLYCLTCDEYALPGEKTW